MIMMTYLGRETEPVQSCTASSWVCSGTSPKSWTRPRWPAPGRRTWSRSRQRRTPGWMRPPGSPHWRLRSARPVRCTARLTAPRRATAARSPFYKRTAPQLVSQNIIVLLFLIYSEKLSWVEVLRHRAPPAWTSSCCLCVLWSFCGSFTPLSQRDRPAVPAAAEATVVWGVRSPCSALSYKDHLSAGQRIPPGANYPIQSKEVLWLVEEVFGPLKMEVDRQRRRRDDFAALYKNKQTNATGGKHTQQTDKNERV